MLNCAVYRKFTTFVYEISRPQNSNMEYVPILQVPQQLKNCRTGAAIRFYQETISELVDLGLQYLEKEEVEIAKWQEIQKSSERTFIE